MRFAKLAPLFLIAPLVAACSSSEDTGTPPVEDSAVAIDSGVVNDTGAPLEDSSSPDTAVDEDTGATEDTGVATETGAVDSATVDSGAPIDAADTSVDMPTDSAADSGADAPIDTGPTCTDGVKNGAESDIDCGGGACSKCPVEKKCGSNVDCATNLCIGGICKEPSCTDGLKNAAETDVDCGGGACPKCAVAKTCAAATDCASGICTGGKCAAPSCTDTLKNGSETDVDCGGGTCAKCADGKSCLAASDCVGGICGAGKCVTPSCTDATKNGAESDVDCGGTCATCLAGKACNNGADCKSGACSAGFCVATCFDGERTLPESDVDCGGTCAKCDNDKKCIGHTDCASGYCAAGVCATPPYVAAFDGASWPEAGWTQVPGSSGAPNTLTAACAHDGAAGWTGGDWSYNTSITVGAPGDKLRVWVKPGAGRAYLGFGATAAGCNSLVAAANTGAILFQENAGYGFSIVATTPFSWTAGKWYLLEASFGSAGAVTGRVYDTDGATELGSLTHTFASFTPAGVAIRGFDGFCIDSISR